MLRFYKALLGSKASTLAGIDNSILKRGRLINGEQSQILAKHIEWKEVDDALTIMNTSKAHRIDGLNTFFPKRILPLIKHEVHSSVHLFSLSYKLYLPMNCTSITLMPEEVNASHISQFRPIACCSTLYKIVSRFLITRLQHVVDDVVSSTQAGFVPNRQFLDNV